MENFRVSLRFSRSADADLINFAANVIAKMTDNLAFPSPFVPLGELTDLNNGFSAALVASDNGGQAATVVKNDARLVLMNALRRQASYVQGISKHDLPKLLSSGFSAASQNSAQSQLTRPVILNVLNQFSTKLTLRITPIANARNYQVQKKLGEGEWEDAGIFSQARRIEVGNLTPGMIYTFRVRALGGITGYSDWSDSISRMSL
jgi:hypothetical protein